MSSVEDAPLLALNMEEEPQAKKSKKVFWKRQGNRLSLRTSRRNTTLTLASKTTSES
jgi:hypothetical protein